MKKITAIILCIATVLSLGTAAFADHTASYQGNTGGIRSKPVQVPISGAYASSELIEDGRRYYAKNAVDGNDSTCWVEGVSGYGRGETITLNFSGTYDVTSLSIVIGWAVNSELYHYNSRPKEIELTFSNGEVFTVTLSDNTSRQVINLPWSVTANSVEIRIVEVYKGGCKDTCISEIRVYA